MAQRPSLWGPLLLAVCGCVSDEALTTVPSGGSLGTHTAFSMDDVVQLKHAPNAEAEGKHVNVIGGKVLHADPQLKIRSIYFNTLGVASEEIFHHDDQVYITLGLAQKCRSDGQLAAVLSMELAKMTLEAERLAGPNARPGPPRPPPDLPVGDYHDSFGGPDRTRQMELYKYDREKRKAAETPLPKAETLAKSYLLKAGYTEQDLFAVAPLLRLAESHVTLEKQITGKSGY
jgi:hypothetical protein